VTDTSRPAFHVLLESAGYKAEPGGESVSCDTSGGYLIPSEVIPHLQKAARRQDARRQRWLDRVYADRLLDCSERTADRLWPGRKPDFVHRYLERRDNALECIDPAGRGEPGPWA